MHVTACLAGQKVDVEVGEECRTIQALREAIVEALPQLCVEEFGVSVGGCALEDDEGVVSLAEGVSVDVSANRRGLSVLALREAGREVSEAGLLAAVTRGDVSLCTLYLDAGVPVDCATEKRDYWDTPLHLACRNGHLEVATLLLDRGSTAIDEKNDIRFTPLHLACCYGHLEVASLLLDRGSVSINEKGDCRNTPLHYACCNGHLEVARLLLDRGSTAIDEKNGFRFTPLHLACRNGHVEVARLLLDRGACSVEVEKHRSGTFGRGAFPHEVQDLLSERGAAVRAKRRRIG